MAYYRPSVYKASIFTSPSEQDELENRKKEEQEALRQSYREQIEEQKQRKRLQKLLDQADEMIHLQNEKNYSPWGRGGGGAPLRDERGDVISDLNEVYSGDRSPVNEPLSPSKHYGSPLSKAGASVVSQFQFDDGKPSEVPYSESIEDASPASRYSSAYFSPVRTHKLRSSEDLLERFDRSMEQQYQQQSSSFLQPGASSDMLIAVEELAILARNNNLPLHLVRTAIRNCEVNTDGKLSYVQFAQKLREQDSFTGNDTIIAPRLTQKVDDPIRSMTKLSSSNLSPKGVLQKGSPIATKMGQRSLIILDQPSSSEQRRAERQRNRLREDLAAQVRQKEAVKQKEEDDRFKDELEWQQELVEKGLDYWGQPIPAGDPRGTARMMAQNTVEKISTARGGRKDEIKNKKQRRLRGGGGEPVEIESGSSPKAFLGSLAEMLGPSPEEQERMDRTRHRLQNDLASQVREQKLKKFQADYERRREELVSRQKKLEKGLDHWGQPIVAGDPYSVKVRMAKEVESMTKSLNRMKRDFFLDQNPEGIHKLMEVQDSSRVEKTCSSDQDFKGEFFEEINGSAFDEGVFDKFITPRKLRENREKQQQVKPNEERQSLQNPVVEKTMSETYVPPFSARREDVPTPPLSEKSFVGLLSDKLYDLIKGAMWNEAYLRRLFAKFDKNGNGRVTAAEFRAAFAKLGLSATKKEMDEFLHRLDPQRRGYVDYLEFIRIVVVNAKAKRANQLASDKRKQRAEKKRVSPPGDRGARGRYRNDQRLSSRLPGQDGTIQLVRGIREAPRHSTLRRNRQQSVVDAQKLDELVELTKRLLREQSVLRQSLARTNGALGVR
jgi:Ca2+-binding EF-hand superfamily protein